MESYDSFFGAQVLRALCRIRCLDIPPELIPGIQSWQALLKICAGSFHATRFPTLLDGFQRILGFWTSRGVDQREATALESLARALLQLAQISGQQLKSCTFSGGIDCAWLAAFADFLFGFGVDIRRNDGQYLYCSNSGHRVHTGEAQVTILKDSELAMSNVLAQKCFSLSSGKALFHEIF